MRQQRTQGAPMAAPATTSRAPTDLPTSGYALMVDGQAKREFKTQDSANRAIASTVRTTLVDPNRKSCL
jgi:hypothetical protein